MSSLPPNPPHRHDSLPPGTRLEEFEIRGLIGVGGFGIVYLAHDNLLHREIALKEYMPAALASRGTGVTVTVSSSRNIAAFEDGRRSFINEARMLARFDHPSLVKVLRFWEANGTAYMVMPLYRGRTLKEVIAEAGPRPESWLRAVLGPLMDAIEILHEDACYHRDIAPDNIQILADGRPLLLDFGAARRVIGDLTQDLTVILKPGYAPIEQYAFGNEAQQGPWTDVYALGAVMRFCATGKAPPPAALRVVEDRMEPLASASAIPLSGAFGAAIDHALAIKAKDRLQSIAELRRALVPADGAPPFAARAPAAKASAPPANPTLPAAPRKASSTERTEDGAPAPLRPRVVRAAVITLLAGGLVMGGIVFYVVFGDRELVGQRLAQDATTSAAPASQAVSPTASVNAPANAPPPVGDTSPFTSPPGPALPPVRSGSGSYDPVQILRDLAATAAPAWKVSVATPKSSIRIKRDDLMFTVASDRPGYLYVLMFAPDGKGIRVLFPNDFDTDNTIRADTPVALPRQNWRMRASGPPGTNHFAALVTPSPRDFTAIGIARRKPFIEFDPQSSEQAFASRGPAAFAGIPTACRLDAHECALHGAAYFEIAEVLN